jgi:exodeoxyribonuclease VIII
MTLAVNVLKGKLPSTKGMFTNIENDLYHADRTMVSKSWLDRVAKSPLHLKQYLEEPYEKTLALIIGSAVDCLVFEPELFDKQFVMSPLEKKTTKAGKEAWAEAIEDAKESNRTIIECHLTDHWTAVHQMADAIMGNPLMKEILKDGVGQAVFIAQDPDTGLTRKCKTDNYHEGSNMVCDLKTAVSASPYEFARSIAAYRYHVQDAYYSDIIKDVVGAKPGFIFAVLEKPPKGVKPDSGMMAFYQLTEEEKLAGRAAYQSDMAAIAFAMDTGEWAGYADQVIEIQRPQWSRNRDQ